MSFTPTYSTPFLQNHADVIRADTRDMRRLVNPLAGIMSTHRNALGYRHSSPHGDSLLFGITGSPSDLPRLSVHCSLLTVRSSYTFSAKERDSESGLSYFGSRYYSSDLSIWLSVDPMSDKYPSLSPYVYCADNPVKLVDPDGEEIDDNLDKWKYNITTKELQWVSDEGGRDHQTVVMTAGKGNDEKAYQKVDFDGPVTLMFNPTVFGEKMDGVINGALDIVNGGITAYYGAAISVGSEGAASPIGYPIFIAGATQMSFGAKKIAYSLNGDYDLYQQHDMMVDICKSVANSAVSTAAGFKNQPLKKISTAIAGVVASFTWSEIQRRKATHPINKGVPKNARIKKLL